ILPGHFVRSGELVVEHRQGKLPLGIEQRRRRAMRGDAQRIDRVLAIELGDGVGEERPQPGDVEMRIGTVPLHQVRRTSDRDLAPAGDIDQGELRVGLADVDDTGNPRRHARRLCRAIRNRMGSAMTMMRSAPVKIDMTMPGTLRRPSPNVTSPTMKAAITTPIMLPLPPRMLTPPSTTMVIASSS